MKKLTLNIVFTAVALAAMNQSYAGWTWGEPESELGEFSFNPTLRANYQKKDYAIKAADNKIAFSMARVQLGYKQQDWYANAEYRCYQFSRLCDFSSLVDAHVGYKINEKDRVSVGMLPIPFGPSQFWDSSFYSSMNNSLGLFNVRNLGVNYHFELPSKTKFDLAYFNRDGGSYTGKSLDSARYSPNLVKSNDPNATSLKEKNMWMARVIQDINFQPNLGASDQDLKYSFGASYWQSELDNQRNHAKGSRQAWSIFHSLNYDQASVTMTAGHVDLNNKDSLHRKASNMGAYDGEYQIANAGYFYTLDHRYVFKNVREGLNITPYVVFSGFNKDEKSFESSQRHFVGATIDYKNLSLYAEYILAKNDGSIGGNNLSFAQGDGLGWNKLVYVALDYNF